MPGIYTIYCHGTGMNRDRNQNNEIVNFFGNQMEGNDYSDALMLDGVGSAPNEHPMAGNFIFDATARFWKRDISKDLSWAKKNPKMAQIAGTGVSGNVAFAIEVLKHRVSLPDTINMIGWSRGAVTAIRLANAMSQDRELKGISLNIFAVDPVAGNDKGEKDDNRNIPAQVENFIGILATGEKRKTFSPQDARRIEADAGTNLVLLPFPGAHDTVAKVGAGGLKDISDVIFSMAGQFLRKFGSQPRKDGDNLSDVQYLERYSKMLLQLDEYKNLRVGKLKGATLSDRVASKGKMQTRDFAKHLDEYVIDPERFINIHHRRLFKACYPHLFTYLFKAKKDKLDRSKVVSEFSALPQTVQEAVLKKVAVPEEEQGPKLCLYEGTFSTDRAKKIRYRGSLNQMGVMQANDKKVDDEV